MSSGDAPMIWNLSRSRKNMYGEGLMLRSEQ